MQHATLQLILHGAIIALIGTLCGIPFGRAIVGRKDEAVIRGWRVAHTGILSTGIGIVVIGLAIPYLKGGSPSLVSAMEWATIISGYAFAIGLTLGPIVGQRGLRPRGPLANLLVYTGNAIGSLGWLVGSVIFVWLALMAAQAG